MIFRIIVAIIISVIVAVLPLVVGAAELSGKGLYITPLRKEITAVPGKTVAGSLTIANMTDRQMTVSMFAQEFSVTDYVYDYKFSSPQNKWIKLRDTQVSLGPKENKNVWYDITIPAKTTPGGYYFALFASSQVSGSGLPVTIRAASLLYLKVDGELIRTSVLQNDSAPFFVTGSDIPYTFDVKNTGNIHFSAYFYGQVDGLFGKQTEAGTSHILMPGTIRSISSVVPPPFLPGIYKLTYGYKVDFAPITTTKTAYFLYIPPWSVALLVLVLFTVGWLWQKRQNKGRKPAKKPKE